MAGSLRAADELKECDICKISTNTKSDLLQYGDWVGRSELTIHYFCLLFSTNLARNGDDCSGISGFLIRDIRQEIREAAKRECYKCKKKHASVCCAHCRRYFHFVCGSKDFALYEFTGQFRGFCRRCVRDTQYSKSINVSKQRTHEYSCRICKLPMGRYQETLWIYCDLCKAGFTHRSCMLEYALNAGYYLRCLWCNKSEFRERVRLQGIFVPDRQAQWKQRKQCNQALGRAYRRCNVDNCLCPKGRDFHGQRWLIITCILCGSFGVHYPGCMPESLQRRPNIKDNYKCPICLATEKKLSQSFSGFQGKKTTATENPPSAASSSTALKPHLSEEESASTDSSLVTVICTAAAAPVSPVTLQQPHEEQAQKQQEQAQETIQVSSLSPQMLIHTSREAASIFKPQGVNAKKCKKQCLPAKQSQENSSNDPLNKQVQVCSFWELNLETLRLEAREATLDAQGNLIQSQNVLEYTNQGQEKLARLKAIIDAELSKGNNSTIQKPP